MVEDSHKWFVVLTGLRRDLLEGGCVVGSRSLLLELLNLLGGHSGFVDITKCIGDGIFESFEYSEDGFCFGLSIIVVMFEVIPKDRFELLKCRAREACSSMEHLFAVSTESDRIELMVSLKLGEESSEFAGGPIERSGCVHLEVFS